MRFLVLASALALAACGGSADSPLDNSPSDTVAVDPAAPSMPDPAPETRVATEAELVGAYDCQMGPGETIVFEPGGRFVVTDFDGGQEDGTWALREGVLTVTTADSTYSFPDLRSEAAVLTLSTGRDEPGSTWVCAGR